MQSKSKILAYLELIAPILPTPIYWEDKNSVILGANDLALAAAGLSREECIGKSLYDLYPYETADHIKRHNDEVIESGKILSQEESIQTIHGQETKHFLSIKRPLYDDEGNIIGVIGTSIDITASKDLEQSKKRGQLFSYLDKVSSILPAPIYWIDLNGVVLGANEASLKAIGTLDRNSFIGKTAFDLYPEEMAEHIKIHNEKVIQTGQTMSQEESIEDISTGEIKYFTAVKAPLRDEENNIIGLVGTSIDITLEKQAERLKAENEAHKKLAQEQKKFMHIANQVVHDIRSPLASLLMIVKSCSHIPETDRVALREAAIGIGDIANHLLNQYQNKEAINNTEDRQPIFVSALLLQILTEKKYQYQKSPIKFDFQFEHNSHFVFIKVESSAFKRMLSNIINNAVDAFDEQGGNIVLRLEADADCVKIFIQDNGKGIPKEVVEKIINRIPVTAGKKSGHGIGLTQVWETLELHQGELAINSKPGSGSTITLTFPRVKAPHWIAEEINLGSQDMVIILDDDNSIHGAWRTRFESILQENINIKLQHFQIGKEALEFINTLSPQEKEHVFLLTDYELLKQELNGLHIIAQSNLKRSVLVTSHYANPLVQEKAGKLQTKILPKQLASEIAIKVQDLGHASIKSKKAKQIKAVIVDDDEAFVNNLLLFIFDEKITDTYHDPAHFLENAHRYPKNIKIFLDNNYRTSSLKGLEIAAELHMRGYTHLYLLSGEIFNKEDLPDYLVLIRKDDIEAITNL